MKKLVHALKITGNVILWLFVVFAIFVTVLVFSAQSNKDGLSSIFGKSLLTIQSDSMSPTFKTGDLIIGKVLTTEEKLNCQAGDVITYYTDLNGDGNDEINTHRIVDVYDEGGYVYYVTKGDNTVTNPVNDATPVVYTKVLAKYTGQELGGVGTIINFLQTSTGFLVVIVIPLVVFFLFELYNFIAVVIKVKTKGRLTADQEEEIKQRAIEEYLRQQGEAAPEEEEAKK